MKKILVADDDPAICDATQLMLEDAGYTVETTIDGEVIPMLKKGNFDLLLLDIWMSGSDGRDIAKYIKTNKNLLHTPIIMISASRDLAKAAVESGAEDFLEKPFRMDDLLAKVEEHIS